MRKAKPQIRIRPTRRTKGVLLVQGTADCVQRAEAAGIKTRRLTGG